jgi:Flp pilus assembly protein protease CpaA
VIGSLAMLIAVICWAGILTWFDFRTRRLPNWLTVGGAAAVLFLRLGYGGLGLFIDGFAAAAVAGTLLLIPFLMHGAGGGDVKMLAAAGAMAGWGNLFLLLWATSLAGVVTGVVMLLAGRLDGARLWHVLRTLFDWRYDRTAGLAALPPKAAVSGRVPFSLPIAIGLVTALVW